MCVCTYTNVHTCTCKAMIDLFSNPLMDKTLRASLANLLHHIACVIIFIEKSWVWELLKINSREFSDSEIINLCDWGQTSLSILSVPWPCYLTAICNINHPTRNANKSKFGTHPMRTLEKYYCFLIKYYCQVKSGDSNCGSPSSFIISHCLVSVFECGRCVLLLEGVHALIFWAKRRGFAFA